jgi:hypothetical protein
MLGARSLALPSLHSCQKYYNHILLGSTTTTKTISPHRPSCSSSPPGPLPLLLQLQYY